MLYRNCFYTFFLLILTGFLYAPIIPEFLNLLMDDNNSHGLLVPFLIEGILLIVRLALVLNSDRY